jgi:hypothetical protein
MWKAVEGVETGDRVWTGDPPHHGKSIEQIVSETWQEKEEVEGLRHRTTREGSGRSNFGRD